MSTVAGAVFPARRLPGPGFAPEGPTADRPVPTMTEALVGAGMRRGRAQVSLSRVETPPLSCSHGTRQGSQAARLTYPSETGDVFVLRILLAYFPSVTKLKAAAAWTAYLLTRKE